VIRDGKRKIRTNGGGSRRKNTTETYGSPGRDHRLHDVDLDHRSSCSGGASSMLDELKPREPAPPDNQSRSGDAVHECRHGWGIACLIFWIGCMLTISEAHGDPTLSDRADAEALRAVEYELPLLWRSCTIWNLRGRPRRDRRAAMSRRFRATYLINACGEGCYAAGQLNGTGSLSFIACRHSMHSDPAPRAVRRDRGASVRPPAGIWLARAPIAGVRPVVFSKPIATPLPHRFSRSRPQAALLAQAAIFKMTALHY